MSVERPDLGALLVESLAGAAEAPDPMRSQEQADRYAHLDVPEMTPTQVARELTLIRLLLQLGHGTVWHAGRECVLAHALRRP